MKPRSQATAPLFITACLLLATGRAHAQWSTSPAVNNAITATSSDHQWPSIISDGSGGAIINWTENRNGVSYDMYAQRVNPTGVTQWTAGGVPVSVSAGNKNFPTMVSDGLGGGIVTWMDGRAATNYDIYAQRINGTGTVQWNLNGVAICADTNNQYNPIIAGDGSGGAIIVWVDARSGANFHVYAQRINAAGVVLWTANGIAICTAGNQDYPAVISDGFGGAIITWNDNRNGNNDIYAQRISPTGTALWTTDGVAICTAANAQQFAVLVSDGSGGAIIAWQDARSLSTNDIYAQRIDGQGNVRWTSNGVGVCLAPNHQSTPAIVSDGSGGAIISWVDARNGGGGDIYAQRVGADSSKLWTNDGVAVCVSPGSQFGPVLLSDGTGGAIITWQDYRNGSTSDLYAQRVDASGTAQWTANGIALAISAGDQTLPGLASDGTGGAIVSWEDNRSGFFNIYAQRVDRAGNLYPQPWIDKVGDVANDQGGELRVLWKPSALDTWGKSSVKSYIIKMGTKATGLLGKTTGTGGTGIYWQTVGTVPADWSDAYTIAVPTLADSGLQGVPYYYLQIIAKSADSTLYWVSNIDSAYSVDNIPPVGVKGAAAGSPGNGLVRLQWNKDIVDHDLMGYHVYRSTAAAFLPGPSNRISFLFDTTYTDSATIKGQTYYYYIAGVDIHGNVGSPSGELSWTVATTGIGGSGGIVPAMFALGQNYPNPFNPSTVISFALPKAAHVVLAVYDLLGVRVATLVDGNVGAGSYQAVWVPKVASGMYIYRLEATSGDTQVERFVDTKKMILLK